MNLPGIKWEEKSPGLYYCYVCDSGQVSYHFRGRSEGIGILCEGEELEERSILGGMDLIRAKNYVKLCVISEVAKGNQHIWARADK